VNTTTRRSVLRTCLPAWWSPARTKRARSRIAPRPNGCSVRLYELELEKQQAALGAERRSQVGTGDRSEKIHLQFSQNRVTDHRIGLTLHQLDFVMEGKLDPIFDALTTYYQDEKLKQQGSEGEKSAA
jgi:peptide chain release factor 1